MLGNVCLAQGFLLYFLPEVLLFYRGKIGLSTWGRWPPCHGAVLSSVSYHGGTRVQNQFVINVGFILNFIFCCIDVYVCL